MEINCKNCKNFIEGRCLSFDKNFSKETITSSVFNTLEGDILKEKLTTSMNVVIKEYNIPESFKESLLDKIKDSIDSSLNEDNVNQVTNIVINSPSSFYCASWEESEI